MRCSAPMEAALDPPDQPGTGPAAWRPLAAALLLAAAHAGLALDAAARLSGTFDEPCYAPAGYARLVDGDTTLNREHPPAGRLLLGATWLGAGLPEPAAVPGYAERHPWAFGGALLYGQASAAPALLLRARAAVALLSGLVVLLVFAAGRRWFGAWAGVAGAALYALDPLVVSHASLATLDVPVTAALFAAATLGAAALDRPRLRLVAAAGLATGLAVATKGTGLVALPALALGWASPWLGVPRPAPRDLARRAAALLGILAVGAAAAWLACLPDGPGAILEAVRLQRAHALEGHPSWLLGAGSWQCSPAYFPMAALVKAPLPSLVAAAAGAAAAAWTWRRHPARALVLLGTPALLLAGAMVTGVCNGLRQLLPAAPFLAVLGGGALALVARRWRRHGGVAIAAAALAWLGLAVARVHPHELAYANEVAGGPERTWTRLSDSNVDWGQALPALAEALRQRPVRRLWLEYFGTAYPPAYGVDRYRRVRDAVAVATMPLPEPRLDGPDPAGRELLAVSATSLVDLYTPAPGLHAWLRGRTPVAFPGHAIALYDITGDAAAHRALAELAAGLGDFLSAAEAAARAEALEHGAP